jgi:hypothetical protein
VSSKKLKKIRPAINGSLLLVWAIRSSTFVNWSKNGVILITLCECATQSYNFANEEVILKAL